MRVSRVLAGTQAEGPGRRTAVWFQGCSIRCKGCINPQLFSNTGGYEISEREIIQKALESGDEGLTLLGGEPMDQPGALLTLAAAAKDSGLGVICFTGYEYASLKNDSRFESLWDNLDLLVDGPYLSDSPELERPLVGSTNQRFLYISDRYQNVGLERKKNRLEVRISAEGNSEVAGFLRHEQVQALAESTSSSRRKRNFRGV